MADRYTSRCRSIGLALGLAACGLPFANAQEWHGNGPMLNDVGTRKVQSLAIDPATGNVYAGTGSGTVFARTDVTLSEPPVAFDDSIVMEPGGSVDIDVLANDFDREEALDPGSVTLQTGPSAGTAAATADGIVTYTPDSSFIGTDVFTYTVRDRAGIESNAAAVSVRVNAPPLAGDDAANTYDGAPVTIDVLANDSDPDGGVDPSTLVIWNSPASGAAAVEANGLITYIPAPGWLGTESFTYKVGDSDGALSNEAVVTVTVLPRPNAAPVAEDDSAVTWQGMAVIIPVLDNDIDPDGTLDPATVAVVSEPAHGGAEVNADGPISYTPDAEHVGDDSFTYTVADNHGESSNAATVTVTVNRAGDPAPPPSPSPGPAPAPRGGGPMDLPTLALLVVSILLKRRLATT